MIKFTQKDERIVFDVRVIPCASKSAIVGEYEGALKIKLTSSPIDGVANKELIILLAKNFSVSKTNIKIISGRISKFKRVSIDKADSSIFSSFVK